MSRLFKNQKDDEYIKNLIDKNELLCKALLEKEHQLSTLQFNMSIFDLLIKETIKIESGEVSKTQMPFVDKLSMAIYFKAFNDINLGYINNILGED